MSVGELVAAMFLAGALLATWRHYHDRFWLVVGLVILAADAVVLARFGLRTVVIAGPISISIVVASTLIGLLFWAQVLGLPRGLALTLGIGLTSRPLRFDARLVALRKPFVEAIALAQTDPDRRAEAIAIAESQIRRERALRPPDPEWAALQDDIADDDTAWVDLLRSGASADRIADHAAAFAPVSARWTEMRERAAADQRLLADPARRRRGNAVWLGVIGISIFLVALAQARAVDLPSLGITDPRFWLIAGMFVGAALAVLGSLVFALRRR